MIDDPLVKSLLTNVVEDESNLPIVQALIDGVETDEAIAEKTEIKLNIVRKILYKLYDMRLATYKRSKDPETQWFTYSWKFEEQEVINHIKSDSEEYLKMLNKELEKKKKIQCILYVLKDTSDLILKLLQNMISFVLNVVKDWAKIVREYGYPEEVQNIVERHIGAGLSEDEAIKLGLPKKSYIPQTIEEKIVAHADNLISGTKEVDVDFDIAKWKRKIDEPEEDIKRLIELDNELIKAFEDE